MAVRIAHFVIVGLLVSSILACAEPIPNVWQEGYDYSALQEWKGMFESKDDGEVDSETRARINEAREALRLTSPGAFGGYYVGVNQNYTHINIAKGKEEMVPQLDDEYLIYHMVDYTLSELEGVHQRFIHYMNELNIQHLYVSVPLNKVYVGVYNPSPAFLADIAKVGVDMDMYFIVLELSPIVLL